MAQTQRLFQSRSPPTVRNPTPRHTSHFATSDAQRLPGAESATAGRSLRRGPRHSRATRRRQSCSLRDSPQTRLLRARSLTSATQARLALSGPDQARPGVAAAPAALRMRGRSAATAAAEGERCGPGAQRGGMASLVPAAAASSPAGAASRSKKRPASPGTGGGPTKKKKATAPGGSQGAGGEAVNENKFLNTDSSTGSVETTAKPLPFKDPNFIHSGIGGAAAGKKNRTWKNLKQILASERALPWQLNDPSYFNIDAPPSFKPAKKYSDISGLPANYTDPQSKLRFSTIEEFAYIRMLPSDVVTGYLALRKATSIVS
ncbi:LOW QUALITY PROTEIN: INO80 complex subunit C [Corvus cornix cornix]|uniref:LOW QUALITY PROTEIN: INO80 complex subunit C n=1 Tax=Corvus cornix cornix TaxID=932674 RepID=UPI0019524480|nr:LOW QUALITY PROTEIN: INO80 complex subunit C [Corvus cornix cornix]